MAVQAGKDLLVKVDMTSDGQFETIAGLRATRVSFNAASCWRGPVCGRAIFQARACFAMRGRTKGRGNCFLTG